MKKVSLDVWVQLIGIFSIVGSLIFVGLEMRQSQTIALAGQVQARNQMLLDNQLVFLGEEPIGRQILAAGLLEQSNPNTLSEEEYAVWRAMVEARVITIQNAFQQYQLGLLTEDVWGQAEERIDAHMRNCHIKSLWMSSAPPSFREYLRGLPEECISEWPNED
jgi:hypothetical protein|tara:strand:- start:30 stop:518 length:489 start_codon:yes stop_codon:yes gene_type:complete